MLSQHREAFFSVAHEHWCWILLREPNDLSDKWMGKYGYIAKTTLCKAKTSDNPVFAFSGLVVDPTICPQAFLNKDAAVNQWNTFLKGGKLPPGFTSETQGSEKGVVKFQGMKIHADFDLMAILNASPDGSKKYTSQDQVKRLFPKVRDSLNQRFGSPMILHGAEMQYKEGIGAKEREQVLIFGPSRQYDQSFSSMPTLESGRAH
ncbi:hypothetical protein [Dyadobacter sp. CY351]|uniref:hypothetical protein n=1 Tax=Dyadobacter sp. CY351 TaxID=2909337 RepID=UPI001F3EBF67|nr:hypothetical protein [Dyadobacter sp. CY351]MCF2518555.1 hypothetical protein [Dyadobacter sp. CY351]